MSRFQSNPSDMHWNCLKRILKYLKGTIDYALTFTKVSSNILVGYCDSDFAGDVNDRMSTSGYLFQVFGLSVCWASKKQSTVALSTTEAKYKALAISITECMWIRGLLAEMGLSTESPTTMY